LGAKEIYLLPGGSIEIDRSVFLTGMDLGQKLKAPVYSILIIHDEGPILIDAGLNPEGLKDPGQAWGPRAKVIKPSLAKEDTLQSRLKQLGLALSDIKMVILTHLHWDHTGSLRFFKTAPIIVQKSEYRFALHPDAFVSAQYMENHFAFTLNYQLVEGDCMPLPGLSLIKTPGHTPGHQSILVRLDQGGSYIFPGDAICLMDNLRLKIPSSNNWNNQQAMDSLHRLEHLSTLLDARIIPSHDPHIWEGLKKSPEPFA